MNTYNTKPAANVAPSLSIVSDAPRVPAHLTNAELHQAVLRLTHAVNNLLQAGVTGREMAQATRAAASALSAAMPANATNRHQDRPEPVAPTPPTPSARKRVLEALATANGGSPGKLTTVELQQRLGLTKSEVWHAYAGRASKNEANLVDSGDVVVLKGRKGGPDVIVHRDAIVVA
jgi:hypothetical protein